MSTLNGRDRRIERLEDAAPKPLPCVHVLRAEEFAPLHLLSLEERAALEDFVTRVQPHLTSPRPASRRGMLDLSNLSNDDFYEWGLWARFGDAVARQDRDAAAKYRRYLTEDREQLIADFLSIDEERVSPLHRTPFRHARTCIKIAVAHNRLLIDDFETMHIWLDDFPPEDQ